MLLDIGFDFVFFAIWFFVSAANWREFDENIFVWFFAFLAVSSGIILGFDIYQVYLFFDRYGIEVDVQFEGRKISDEDQNKDLK